jgi:hypothetical protein
MDWLKYNGLTILIFIILGVLVFKSFYPSRSEIIDLSVQKQLDSAKATIVEKNAENRYLLKEKEEAEKEKQLLIGGINAQLSQAKPKYNKVITDYKKATPEQKKKIVSSEYERRKKEMESAKVLNNN